ncbi:MAG: hypothetical protein ABIS20_01850 [Thermoanaerobaculia bacterium]
MNGPEDRLYELLPAIHRQRDFELGKPLRALLQVIAEQVNAVEEDIGQLYDNWFIETCQDWVVPYLGDLIGYRPVPEAGRPGGADLNKALIPRREVANTLRYRRSKGTLALLELLALDVAGWPARAVEFYELLGFTQHMSHSRLDRGRTLDLRRGEALGHLGSPFTGPAYTASVGRPPGLSGVGLFVWRLRSYPISMAPACLVEKSAKNLFTFSVLCNDTPLFVRPMAEDDPAAIAGELNLPIPISRRAFEARKGDYYGPDKSVYIWVGKKSKGSTESVPEPVPLERIVVADLSDWRYAPPKDKVAVDPETGRIVFPRDRRDKDVWVSYSYGFSADVGGGEYDRLLSQPEGATVIQVKRGPKKDDDPPHVRSIGEAIALAAKHPHAVIEILDSEFYAEPVNVELAKDQTLQIRAARRTRPVISLPELRVSATDALTVTGEAGSAFTLDGVMVVGRSVQVRGDLAALTLRHCTLVPGWGLENDCNPRWPNEPSLELFDLSAVRVTIERSIVGSIYVSQDEVGTDPISMRISDSIVDATRPDELAVGAVEAAVAHVRLTVERCTVFGQVRVHALELGENSLFEGVIRVARRRIGCLRFSSYLPDPDTRTPRRFECQPDLAGAGEEVRVRPRFRSVRYGSPLYARLSDHCAEEIRRGADDQSEMGVFHHLYEPQRAANLRARLEEYTPAGGDADLIYADQEAP